MIEFLGYCRTKGLLPAKTAEAYKSAAMRVLSIDGPTWNQLDVRHVDVAEQVNRFARLEGQNVSPGSLSTYRSRLASAIRLYDDYLKSPASFRVRGARPRNPKQSLQAPEASRTPILKTPEPRSDAIDLITYPFPLRAGHMAYLQLPRRLDPSDAKRLAGFLESIAVEDDSRESISESGARR